MFKVVTRTRFPAERRDEVLELSRAATGIAAKQPGFEGIRVHLSSDGSHTLTYWEWRSEADHLACMQSADWADWNPRWEALMADGGSFDLETYTVVAELPG